MNLLSLPLLLGGPLVVGAFLAYGMGYRLTRNYLKLALSAAESENYEVSRRHILNAVRLIPKYKQHPELVAFYDAVVEKRAAKDVLGMREAMSRWPVTKLERLYQSDGFAIAFVAVLLLSALAKLASLR